jgi:16S rRNA (guanine527-N7)-methyltransferase
LRDFWIGCGLSADDWPGAIDRYARHRELIEVHSAAADLMGPGGTRDFYLKHVADSLAVLKVYPRLLRGAVRLADVGCGAGLPGVALAVALPELLLTAVESNRRKADFVAMTAAELGLTERVRVLPRRSREIAADPQYAHAFDVVTVRAVAPAEKAIRDCRRLIAPGGSGILYKTPGAAAGELPAARRLAEKHRLGVEASEQFALPAGAGRRQFIRIISPPRQ